MTKNIFIATTEPYSGKSIVALGLMNRLLGRASEIGYFKPIINHSPQEKKDVHIETIITHFGLPVRYEDTFAFTREQAMKLAEEENTDELIDTIIRKYKQLEEKYDFIVVEGSDFLGGGVAFEFNANVSFAKNLGAPVIIVISGGR